MATKNALRLHEVKTVSAAGLATIQSEVVPHDQVWCIQRLTIEGSLVPSGGNTRCRLYIDGHGYKHYLSEQDAPVAGALYWYDDPVWLIPGERIAVDWDQAQADTTLELIATGYWTEAKEGIV